MSSTTAGIVKKAAGLSIVLSVLMIIAGLLAIALPQVAGIAVNLLIGWLLVFGGIFHLAFAWRGHSHGGGVLWEALLGILYLLLGGYLLFQPVRGLASLTLALAWYLLFKGILEIILSVRIRPAHGSGWLLVDAVITLILAVLIWRTWPSSTDWVIGTLVGISMLFSGFSRLMLSVTSHRLAGTAA